MLSVCYKCSEMKLQLRSKGYERVKKYTWEKSAIKIQQLFKACSDV